VAAITVLLVSACGSSGSSNAGSTANSASSGGAAGAPKSGGTLTIGEAIPITYLDPATQQAGHGTLGGIELAAIYDPLMRFDTKTEQYVPEMAQSLTSNADHTMWTLKLRPNVKFTNGEVYDAQNVINNINRAMAVKTNTELNNLKYISNMTAPDPLTVVFQLNAEWAGFPNLLAEKSGDIVAPAMLAQLASNPNATPIGAGPFMYQSFRSGEELALVRNPDYWDGAPYLDGVKFTYVNGAPATYQAFEAGQNQMAVILDFPTEEQVKQAGLPNYFEPDILGSGGLILLNNAPDSPFANVTLRKAFAAAINPQVLNQVNFQGTADVYTGLLPPDSRWTYEGQPAFKYDATAAKSLLQQAESEIPGFDGTVAITGTNQGSQAGLTELAAQLRAVGFKPTVSNVADTNALVQQVLVKHQYQIAPYGFNVNDNEPFPLLSKYTGGSSPNNAMNYKDAKWDAALDDLRKASTKPAAQAAMKTLAEEWYAQAPSYVYANLAPMVFWQKNIEGVIGNIDANMLLTKTWIRS
jgi:peptide/nickel transport system substrate-binding protein